MRPATATAAAVTTILGIGTAAVAAGRYASDAALAGGPHPFPGDRRLTVHATAAGQVTLTRSFAALRPGTYGLAGRDVHAIVGPVLGQGPDGSADTVVRRLERVTRGSLEPGAKVRLTPQLHSGDPLDGLGLAYEDVEIPGELGALPGWFLPGDRDTWVITVHGLGATREQPMNVLAFLESQRLPVLNLAYRGDAGAPRSPDGLAHLGESEWRDLDAAIRHAVRHGAKSVVVHGWSTGASMALHAAVNSALRDRIAGLVLDSPVMDWQVTLRALAGARGVPAALLPLAVRAAQGQTGLHGAPLMDTSVPTALHAPTLIFHGPDDTLAPWQPSRELAARRPDLVTLHPVADAQHGAMWNVDPADYEEILRRFLTPLM